MDTVRSTMEVLLCLLRQVVGGAKDGEGAVLALLGNSKDLS